VPLSLHWGESPSPLTSCPGYVAPAGLPLVLQFGPGAAPVVSATTFARGEVVLDHCVFGPASYANPDVAAQAVGRSVLADRGAVVLVPRAPLAQGATYTASVTADGTVHRWSFTVGTGLGPYRSAMDSRSEGAPPPQ
jgi:hypothetical protein